MGEMKICILLERGKKVHFTNSLVNVHTVVVICIIYICIIYMICYIFMVCVCFPQIFDIRKEAFHIVTTFCQGKFHLRFAENSTQGFVTLRVDGCEMGV